MTTHKYAEFNESTRRALLHLHPLARQIPMHLISDHHLDTLSNWEWLSALDSHLSAFLKRNRPLRKRLRELQYTQIVSYPLKDNP